MNSAWFVSESRRLSLRRTFSEFSLKLCLELSGDALLSFEKEVSGDTLLSKILLEPGADG